ncbi:MAG: hypothetical protein J0G36_17310 [Afipia sp.]|nr:hypothetical protein [Afipia sp.]
MSTIPWHSQTLPNDLILETQTKIKNGLEIAGTDLVRVVEHAIERPLPSSVREIVEIASVAPTRTRGRPSNFGARQDFAMSIIDRRYPALLRYEERKREALQKVGALSTADALPPSALAYERLRLHMKKDLNFIATWESLRNLHSKWKNGHLHQADYPETDDLSDQIDLYFPAPKRS